MTGKPLPGLTKLELATRVCEQCRVRRDNPADENLSRDELIKLAAYLDVLGAMVGRKIRESEPCKGEN